MSAYTVFPAVPAPGRRHERETRKCGRKSGRVRFAIHRGWTKVEGIVATSAEVGQASIRDPPIDTSNAGRTAACYGSRPHRRLCGAGDRLQPGAHVRPAIHSADGGLRGPARAVRRAGAADAAHHVGRAAVCDGGAAVCHSDGAAGALISYWEARVGQLRGVLLEVDSGGGGALGSVPKSGAGVARSSAPRWAFGARIWMDLGVVVVLQWHCISTRLALYP